MRYRLWYAQDGKCNICFNPLQGKINIEHVTPRHLGGKHGRNRLLSHVRCNTKKADRAPTKAELEFLAKALKWLDDNP